jgi:hypothetical protein
MTVKKLLCLEAIQNSDDWLILQKEIKLEFTSNDDKL